jgi:TolA-binding protein
MSTLRFVAAVVSALLVGAVQAQTPGPSSGKTPLTQGIESVDKNLQKDQDHKGLQTASERLKANQERFEARRETTDERIDEARARRVERAERPELVERPEHFDRPEKPERSGR